MNLLSPYWTLSCWSTWAYLLRDACCTEFGSNRDLGRLPIALCKFELSILDLFLNGLHQCLWRIYDLGWLHGASHPNHEVPPRESFSSPSRARSVAHSIQANPCRASLTLPVCKPRLVPGTVRCVSASAGITAATHRRPKFNVQIVPGI